MNVRRKKETNGTGFFCRNRTMQYLKDKLETFCNLKLEKKPLHFL